MCHRRRSATTAAVVVAFALLLPGCKRDFAPGAYRLVSVQQVSESGPTGEQRAELAVRGTAEVHFAEDGTLTADFESYAVHDEPPCSALWWGRWAVDDDVLAMEHTKGRLDPRCRQYGSRSYLWELGWNGALLLKRPWDETSHLVYRFEPL